MPTYSAKCQTCGETVDYIRTVADRGNVPTCHKAPMLRIISAPYLFVPMDIRYDSPVNGRVIQNKRERADDLARTGSRPWEGLESEKREAARQQAYKDQALDAKIGETATETFHQMPKAKRDILTGAKS